MSAYSTAVTVLPTQATGIYTSVKGKAVLTRGRVTLNVVNGVLNSVTVVNPSTRRKVMRVEADGVKGVSLSFPSRQDSLTLQALTR